jgi:hypothetical protein
MAGALQLQRKFKLEGEEYRKLTGQYSFTNDTAANTYDWSESWVNDRVYPFRCANWDGRTLTVVTVG